MSSHVPVQVVLQGGGIPHQHALGVRGQRYAHRVRCCAGSLTVLASLPLRGLRTHALLPCCAGLVAFELPLVYITGDKFNQPIFGCNNLSGGLRGLARVHRAPCCLQSKLAYHLWPCRAGKCWPAVGGGGPAGTLPPHSFAIYFKEGGVGTFLPLYFRCAV